LFKVGAPINWGRDSAVKNELVCQYQDWLIEIEYALKYLLKWLDRFPQSEPASANEEKLTTIERMALSAQDLLEKLPEFAIELRSGVLPGTLRQTMADVRRPVVVIHSHLGLFKLLDLVGVGAVTTEEAKVLERISKYAELLLILANEFEQPDKVLAPVH